MTYERERRGMVHDGALFELFAPRRVDPDGFRAGIARRIAEAEAGREATAPRATPSTHDEDGEPSLAAAHPAFWRRVAALLPLDPGGGALSGAAAAKVFGGKVLPAAIALPALVLAALIGGFASSAWSLRRGAGPPTPAGGAAPRARTRTTARAERTTSIWVQLLPLGVLGVLMTPWRGHAVDVVVLVFTLTMLGLAASVRRLAAEGLLDRASVGLLVVGLVVPLLSMFFVQLPSMGSWGPTSELGVSTGFVALAAAALAAQHAIRGRPLSRTLCVVCLSLVLVTNPLGVTFSSPLAARWQLARAQRGLDPHALRGWRQAGALHRALVAVGAEPARPEALARKLRAALASEDALGVHPVVWTAAFDMGLMRPEDWRALDAWAGASDRTGNRTDYYRYTYPLRLVVDPPSPAERDAWAAGLVEDWPETGEHGALTAAAEVVRRVELLDRAELLPPLRERAHALLRDHWTSPQRVGAFGSVGGFTSNPAKFDTSFTDETLAAVELMARFGVPEGIDVTLLRTHLLGEARARLFLPYEPAPYLRAEARAALLRLRGELELPPRGPLGLLLDERFAVASVLLAALALFALRASAVPGRGARP